MFECTLPRSDINKFLQVCNNDITNCIVSYKLDGIRCLTTYHNGKPICTTRNGNKIYGIDHILKDLGMLYPILKDIYGNDFIGLDGELYSPDLSFDELSGTLRNMESSSQTEIKYFIFDINTHSDITLLDRLEKINTLVNCTPYDIQYLHTVPWDILETDIIYDTYKYAKDQGYEGLVLKHKDKPYILGRSNYWCKLKDTHTEDVSVLSSVEGTGKYMGMLGALICEQDGTTFKVGTGFTDAQRKEFFIEAPSTIEIKYQYKTKAGKPRHPVFIRERIDK